MKDIKKFLANLSKELQHNEDFDIEARKILEDLNRNVEEIEEPDGTQVERMRDLINQLESKFAAEHPSLERAVRELTDALAKMGI